MQIEFDDGYELQSNVVDKHEELQSRVFEKLRAEILKLGISEKEFTLGESIKPEDGKYILVFENRLWVVYFIERNKKLNPAFFASIWDASRYLLWELVRHQNPSKRVEMPEFITDLAILSELYS